MKKITQRFISWMFGYFTVVTLIALGATLLVMSPELARFTGNCNFGPVLASVLAGVATLVWDRISD